jgi:hypothetical protein
MNDRFSTGTCRQDLTIVFAVRIYQGQRMVLGQSSDGPLLREMQVFIGRIVSSSHYHLLHVDTCALAVT